MWLTKPPDSPPDPTLPNDGNSRGPDDTLAATPHDPVRRDEGHIKFRPDIEGLRAVAIIFVVLYHTGMASAGGGYLGVDVFFVLSGFLISGIIVDEVVRTGRLSLTNFWARRARRLLPAAAVVTLVVIAANLYFLSPFEQIARAGMVKAFAIYASNILLAVRSTDYFGAVATSDPLMHSWSLSVEEQFYFVFAPLLFFLAVWARKYGADVFRRRLAIITVALSLASLIGCLVLVQRYPVVTFYLLPPRAWEFGLGVVALFALPFARRTGESSMALLEAVGLLSLVGLLGSGLFLNETRAHPLGFATLIPTLSAVGLILTGAGPRPTWVAKGLSLAPIRLVGRLSYSWYLWHWPALVYVREVVPSPSLSLNIAVALASIIPAAMTYAWVESPVRFSRTLQSKRVLAIAGAVVLAMLTYAAGKGVAIRANRTLATPRYAAITAARVQPRVYDDGCQVPLLGVVSPPCAYGPARNDTTVVLFGDSHAAHWFPALDSVATLRGWKYVHLTKTGCPYVIVGTNHLGRRYTECEEWRRYAIDRIVKLHPTIVILASKHHYNILMNDRLVSTDSSEVARELWKDGLKRTLTELGAANSHLIVLQDTPKPGFDIPECLVKHIDNPTACDVPRDKALYPVLATLESSGAAAVPGVSYMSLNSILCDDKICPVMRERMVRYSDADHLSVQFSASLGTALSNAITTALAGGASR